MKKVLVGLVGLTLLAGSTLAPAGAESGPPKGIGRWSDPVLVSSDQADRKSVV